MIGNKDKSWKNGRLHGWSLLATFAVMGTTGTIAAETATVIGHFDALSGESKHYEIIRGTEKISDVRIRTELQQGDFIRIKASGNTAVIQFADGSREELGPVAGLYGPYLERGGETTLLTNVLTSLWGTVSDFRSRPVETIVAAARGEGDPIVMGKLFTDFPRVLVEGNRSLFFLWDGGNAPYRVRITHNDAVIIDAKGIETQRFRSKLIELAKGKYVVEITDTENKFGFSFQVATAHDLPDEIQISNTPAAVAEYLNAYALAITANNVWAFESYQRLADLAEQGYEPASQLMQDIEEGEARYWEIPANARGRKTPSSGEPMATANKPPPADTHSTADLAPKDLFGRVAEVYDALKIEAVDEFATKLIESDGSDDRYDGNSAATTSIISPWDLPVKTRPDLLEGKDVQDLLNGEGWQKESLDFQLGRIEGNFYWRVGEARGSGDPGDFMKDRDSSD